MSLKLHGKIPRILRQELERRVVHNPVTAILGSRQCGKSTLARQFLSELDNDSILLDLEKPSDLNRLHDLEAFFQVNSGKLICFDEIQKRADIFSVMRSFIDEQDSNGLFLILGSASVELLRQSSETLAGRISFLELTPFLLSELDPELWRDHWLKGGYPRSFLAQDYSNSFQWRTDYILSYLQRDLPQLGFHTPAESLHRFWSMCAHLHGHMLNFSKIADSMGVSSVTIKSWFDILDKTFVVRALRPYAANLKKRLVKTPKLYIRDSGLLHALLDIKTHNDLLGHPVYGNSFEGYVIENLLGLLPSYRGFYYRTSHGAEIDLLLISGQEKIAIEIKASTSPKPSKGFYSAIEDLQPTQSYIVGQVDEGYPYRDDVQVLNLTELLQRLSGKDEAFLP